MFIFTKVIGDEPDSDETWIDWFCRKKGNEFLCKVETSYIMDKFNLHDLKSKVEHYDDALLIILDMEKEDKDPLAELRKKDMDT